MPTRPGFCGLRAQPGSSQGQSQFVLTQAGGPLDQPGMALLAQQVRELRLNPGRPLVHDEDDWKALGTGTTMDSLPR